MWAGGAGWGSIGMRASETGWGVLGCKRVMLGEEIVVWRWVDLDGG